MARAVVVGLYCPTAVVTREQMAIFLLRAIPALLRIAQTSIVVRAVAGWPATGFACRPLHIPVTNPFPSLAPRGVARYAHVLTQALPGASGRLRSRVAQP